MATSIVVEVEGREFRGELSESEAAAALASRLPLEVRLSRWGEEYYGDVGEPLGVGLAVDARDLLEIGELAYWPPGNALCIFFGPTPASEGEEPRAASPVNPIGRLQDASELSAYGGGIVATVRAAE